MEDELGIFYRRHLLSLCLISVIFFIQTNQSKIDTEWFRADVDRYCEKILLNESSNCSQIINSYLYFDAHRSAYHLYEDKTSMKTAPFVPKVPIKIILHGFNGSYCTSPNIEIRPEYLLKGYNVISLDYAYYVQYPCSEVAAYNVRVLGICFAKFVKYVLRTKVQTRKINRTDLHVIGYNLGAQIAGRAGIILKNSYHLGRLTALDPILPLFYGSKNYISQESADFVDVIHTRTKMYKKLKHLGHVDYYVNSALFNNVCTLENPECYTSLAPHYFGESISKDKYYFGYDVYLKSSKVVMGECTPSNTRGVYGVFTNKEPPYTHDGWPPHKKFIGVYRIGDLRITTVRPRKAGSTQERRNNFITKMTLSR